MNEDTYAPVRLMVLGFCFVTSQLVSGDLNLLNKSFFVKSSQPSISVMQNYSLPDERGRSLQAAEAAIAPNSCRIIGKIVAISAERDKDKNVPCGKTACKALVSIEKIVGYGAAFNQILPLNEPLNMYFTFTLGPAKQYFPDLTQPLPGLQIGNLFEADIRYNPDGQANLYQVSSYTKK